MTSINKKKIVQILNISSGKNRLSEWQHFNCIVNLNAHTANTHTQTRQDKKTQSDNDTTQRPATANHSFSLTIDFCM